MSVMSRKLGILVVLLAVVATGGSGKAELIAYWGFDDRDLNVAREERGGKDGEIVGKPRWVKGRIGGALKFDGRSDYIRIKHDPVFDIRNAVTIAAWVKSSRLNKTFATVIAKGDGTWRIARDGDRDTLQFAANKDGALWVVCGNTRITDDKWHHIVGVFDGAEASLYVDGELDNQVRATTPFNTDAFDVCIGENAERTGRCWRGLIDDVLILDYALNASEVESLYARGARALVSASLGGLSGALSDARKVLTEQGAGRAVSFIEKKLADGTRKQKETSSEMGSWYAMAMSELYFLLAEAQRAAGAPEANVVRSYKSAVTASLGSRQYVPAVLWLFEHVNANEYADAVRESVRGDTSRYAGIPRIVAQLEESGNWPAFERFLEAGFAEVADPLTLAVGIGRSLADGSEWAEAFVQYCRIRPPLKPYYLSAQGRFAEQLMARHDFTGAVEIYRGMMGECGAEVDTTAYELKICECLLGVEQYQQALTHIERFLGVPGRAGGPARHHAMLLKGRAHMHLGEIDRAIEIFSRLGAAEAAGDLAAEPRFLAGYCSMLLRDLDTARQTLTMVAETFPESSFARKARLCLARIERMRQ